MLDGLELICWEAVLKRMEECDSSLSGRHSRKVRLGRLEHIIFLSLTLFWDKGGKRTKLNFFQTIFRIHVANSSELKNRQAVIYSFIGSKTYVWSQFSLLFYRLQILPHSYYWRCKSIDRNIWKLLGSFTELMWLHFEPY